MSWQPPKPDVRQRFVALLGGIFRASGRSMLNLLPKKAYAVQMGVARVARQRLFLVNAPETIKEVMQECPRRFPKHRFLQDILTPLIGRSLFNTNGEEWAQQRRLVDQAFEAAALRSVFPLMWAGVEAMEKRILTQIEHGSVWDAEKAMGQVTADIIHRAILSVPLSQAGAEQVHRAFLSYQNAAQRVMGLSTLHLPTWWHRRLCKREGRAIRETYAPIIRQRLAQTQGQEDRGTDMLAALINARDPLTQRRLSETEIVDQVSTLFLAGHETSASTLAWALWLIAARPEWLAAIREEADRLWAGRTPAFSDLRSLPITQQVFRETLRLYPPIAFYIRTAAQATTLRGKCVHQGDMVVVSPWVVHRHEGLWSEPDAFDPTRFAQGPPQRGAYIPFGVGERACPGAGFANQESVLILARMAWRFDLSPIPERQPAPVARLTLRSVGGVYLHIRPRTF